MVFKFPKRNDATIIYTVLVIRNDFFDVDIGNISQALAMGTSSFGRVERKNIRGRIFVSEPCDGIHQPFRIIFDGVVRLVHHHNQPVTLFHGSVDGLCQTSCILGLNGKFIDDHFNIVVFVAVCLHAPFYVFYFSINTNIQITFFPHRFKQLSIVAFAVSYKRSKNIDFFLGIVVEYHLYDLFFCILYHSFTAQIAIGNTSSCIKQTQIIVYFRDGSDC